VVVVVEIGGVGPTVIVVVVVMGPPNNVQEFVVAPSQLVTVAVEP
jgi:hypothetical protein